MLNNNNNLLVIAFIIKLLAQNHLFKYLKEKHGQDTFLLCRKYEKLCVRQEKTKDDLRFLLKCKHEKLLPVFARPKLSIKTDYKTKCSIAKLIIQTELKNKHRIKNKQRNELIKLNCLIRSKVNFLLFEAFIYKVRCFVNKKRCKWIKTHDKKIECLRSQLPAKNRQCVNSFSPNVVHNFSSYILSNREIELLSFTLDHYVPYKHDVRKIEVAFEKFYQHVIPHTTHLDEREKTGLKSKFLSTFRNYSKIKNTCEQQQVIDGLRRNKNIVILKQDKGRGVVVMNKSDYFQKALGFLEEPPFIKLGEDPTKSFQGKVQRTLLKMKNAFDKKTYKTLYPSSSHPGLFFGLAKLHKMPYNSNDVKQLPLRPVISNIGTATYELSRYLSQLLSPLAKSQYTIDSTKQFIQKIGREKIEDGYKMVSFDVKSLYTNVPLDHTINIILDKVYNEGLINTKLKRNELHQLLNLCTKELHFSFGDEIYQQTDGVAMGSPLGPVIANIFMVELEKNLVQGLSDKMKIWYRYVDDTFCFIKENEIENVRDVLNGFHENIGFTYEVENSNSLSFLDVRIIKNNDGSFETKVFRKETDTNIYIHWKSFAPKQWKIGTLKGLIRRAHVVSSNDSFLQNEINHLRHVFTKINGFPNFVFEKTLNETVNRMSVTPEENNNGETNRMSVTPEVNNTGEVNEFIQPCLVLPYQGRKGEDILKGLKNCVSSLLPNQFSPRFVYNGKKVGSFFPIKDKVKEEHQSGLVYKYECGLDCNQKSDYVGETKVRYETRVYEHINTDKKSAIFKHTQENNHVVRPDNFRILDKGYNKVVDRKIAEALFIRDLKPNLNEQVHSTKLRLFSNDI